MAKPGQYALTKDGRLTWCTVQDPEKIGKGRCNHIAHQKKDESPEQFVERVNKYRIGTPEYVKRTRLDTNYNLQKVLYDVSASPEEEDKEYEFISSKQQLFKPSDKEQAIKVPDDVTILSPFDINRLHNFTGESVVRINDAIYGHPHKINGQTSINPSQGFQFANVNTAMIGKILKNEGLPKNTHIGQVVDNYDQVPWTHNVQWVKGSMAIGKWARDNGFQVNHSVYVLPYAYRQGIELDGEEKQSQITTGYQLLFYHSNQFEKNKNKELDNLVDQMKAVQGESLDESDTYDRLNNMFGDDVTNGVMSEETEQYLRAQGLNDEQIEDYKVKIAKLHKTGESIYNDYVCLIDNKDSKHIYCRYPKYENGYAATSLNEMFSRGHKKGIIRDTLEGSAIGYGGRAVLGVDDKLEPGNVSIPPQMACQILKPTIADQLKQGVHNWEHVQRLKPGPKPGTVYETDGSIHDISEYPHIGDFKSDKEVDEYLDQLRWKEYYELTPEDYSIINNAMDQAGGPDGEVRVLVTRAPSLATNSVRAFVPHCDPEAGSTIHINPLDDEGFAGDQDGDVVAAIGINSANLVKEIQNYTTGVGELADENQGYWAGREKSAFNLTKDAKWGVINSLESPTDNPGWTQAVAADQKIQIIRK